MGEEGKRCLVDMASRPGQGELMSRMGQASPRAALLYQHATRDRDAAIASALSKLIVKGTSKSEKRKVPSVEVSGA
ncbi:MAG: hypothetical protein ACRDZ6_06730 [Acidimicrobiales bacterium]